MKIKTKLFFAVISMIFFSATVLAEPDNDNCAKNLQAKNAINLKALVADFDIIASFSTEPPTINFLDKSTGSPTFWFWDFGDESTSIVQNPIHKYTVPGKYTVTLTVTKFMYSSTVKKIISFTGCEKMLLIRPSS